jgi:hypothetical protein
LVQVKAGSGFINRLFVVCQAGCLIEPLSTNCIALAKAANNQGCSPR